MNAIVTLLVDKLLEYVSGHIDEIVSVIRKVFNITEDSTPAVRAAVQEFGYEPNHETLNNLHDALKADGKDVSQLASVIINKAEIPTV